MWGKEDRAKYERRGLGYRSDLTDAEWVLIGCHIPPVGLHHVGYAHATEPDGELT